MVILSVEIADTHRVSTECMHVYNPRHILHFGVKENVR